MKEHGPEMLEFGSKLKSINKMMEDLGCSLDPKIFDDIDEDTDYIKNKKYKEFLPGDRVKIEATLRPVKTTKRKI